ncbi:dienelactone hydrolase family protein [Actinoplanes sp. N902-109]|uniref:dienelactone hydrolase family protein n=1 Tax=Actinoplanes sp. (strain N902-109) TaxID=649831 RepID=UPI0003293E57|nr:dienelactone hydrolase family protein [Actinoplanes sp. N902-109]AGL21507.1 hydrolase [Actinoplanes sp. N902-109]
METINVDIPAPDGVADGCLVLPDGDGPFPGVLLFPDAFGLRPRIHEMAGRIAGRGYAVLAPNLLYRAGRSPLITGELSSPEGREKMITEIYPYVIALDTATVLPDIQAYLDFFAAQPKVAAEPVVITGYCMGGTNAFKAIGAFPDRIKAIASFHGGRLATDQPDSPHLKAGAITGELYFGHADNDQSMDAGHIATLEKALDDAGVTYTSEVYEGAPHGYTMSDTAMYHEAAEKRHWDNLFALLERCGETQPSSSPGK